MTRRYWMATAAAPLSLAHAAPSLTAGTLIERIEKQTGIAWKQPTVDTLKTGSPGTAISGVAVSFMATFAVLEQAAKRKLNFIVTHEPTFYNHLDETKAVEQDAVYRAKRTLIDEHHLCVFRFQDYWHRMRPDGIRTGMVEAMGWKENIDGDLFRFPHEPRLGDLASELKKRLKATSIRVIGNPAQVIRRAALQPGAGGSREQMSALANPEVDLLVIGETREWETVEYARDALQQGRSKALIILGHAISEEGGMAYCARWIRTFVTEVPVEFILAGEPYWPAR